MSESDVRRLNWGCGSWVPESWVNADLHEGEGIDWSGDILDGLPCEDDHFDYVVSVHALPMIPIPRLVEVLAELRRVLKPGGTLRLCLPDLDKGIAAYQRGDRDHFMVPDEDFESLGGKFIVHMLWYGWTITMFTTDFIEELLTAAGYIDVQHLAHLQSATNLPGITDLDNREDESLFVEAVNPGP